MKFSVVIPTFRRPDMLAACLGRLAPDVQTLSAKEYEIIVTDDDTADPVSAALTARFPTVRWVSGPRRGPAANRNHGATFGRGDWLVFTDDDCLPDPQWLAGFAVAMDRNPAAQVLEGRTYVDRPRTHPLEFSPLNSTGGHLWSCNFAIRRDLFAAVGGFDLRFPHNAMEDVELCLRLAQQKHMPVFVPEAAVLHPWRRIENWPEHAKRHLASRVLLESIHPGGGFPVPWSRAIRVHARVAFTEHLPWLIRRPWATARVLPALWRSMAEDVWMTRRYHRTRRSLS